MDALSLSELKGLCQQRKLPVSGTKSELIERLTRGSHSSGSSALSSSSAASSRAAPTKTAKLLGDAAASSALFPSDYDALAIPQLKDLCRERLLPVGGIKDDIVARLKASDPRNMTLVQLKDQCRDAALPVTGTKVDLIERVLKRMSSGTTALLQTKSVDELKDLCRERGVAVSGKKDELVERLKQASSSTTSLTVSTATKTSSKAANEKKSTPPNDAAKKAKSKAAVAVAAPSYESMTMPQLKELCREKKLVVGGTKDELVERLNKAKSVATARPLSASRPSSSNSLTTTSTTTTDSGYDAMMVPQLKDLCRSRTLPVMGTKEELVKRLREHDDVVRAMFKKRKNPSSHSITTTASSAASSSSGKRRAPSDEPKANKIKTKAFKTTAGVAMRPPTAHNVGAFALPTTEMFVARKNAPPKAKKTPLPTKSNGRYLVYSTCAYPPDHFHTYAGPGEPKYHGTYATKKEANDRVSTIFYDRNPWGIGKDEIDGELDMKESWKKDLLRLKVCPPDSEEWVVGVRDTSAMADDDGDVVMVSGSDTEEDDYGYGHGRVY